jgi:hypothetical protein
MLRLPDLGLVIDLTKTTRYYSADLFGETCKVQKIACEGCVGEARVRIATVAG